VSFFAAFLLLRRAGNMRGATVAGMLTYPLYLLHQRVGYLLLPLWPNPWFGLALTATLMLGAAWLVAEFVEKRPRRLWIALAARAVDLVAIRVRRPRVDTTSRDTS
jgi:peptidoglycan/LPS O-acetylase OafA/YrhL